MNQIFNIDCLEGLKTLISGSVQTCVTSPPYFGLRDYGIKEQIGLEPTPDDFVKSLVSVFREVRRVLRDDGTLWLNLGDSYAREGGRTAGVSRHWDGRKADPGGLHNLKPLASEIGLKQKDLIGVPWRVAFALQTDGWYLRQDIIWHKPNPMPESVTDRCTKSHEYIFLLSKSPRYYFDAEAIKEPAIYYGRDKRSGKGNIRYEGKRTIDTTGANGQDSFVTINEKKNKRDVWSVATRPCKEAHFATFPQDLIRPCVLAGAPVDGLVLDPFMGAGTTAVVAKQEGRNYVGFELNPEYVKIAEKRITAAAGPLDNIL